MRSVKRPPVIKVTEVLSSEKDPKWNYGRFMSLAHGGITLQPCCLKSKPCWECK